jgi:YfiR/HmsC-like
VSDADGFAQSGGVAELIVENDRMRFAINVASAHRTRLSISSKLLSLAIIVNDGGKGKVP